MIVETDKAKLVGIEMIYEKPYLWKSRIASCLVSTENKITTLFTVNFELLSIALKEKKYRDILKSGTWVTVDGITISLFIFLRSFKKIRRICGSDLIFDLFQVCQQNHKRIAIIGGQKSRLNKALENAQFSYPQLDIVGFSPDFPCPLNIESGSLLAEFIKKHKPEVVATCLGSPKQEYWIDANLKFFEDNGVKIVTGLGGTVDFLAGALPRAPKILRLIGLEWFWRCLLEPFRFQRYYKSCKTVVSYVLFPAKKNEKLGD